MSTRTYGGHTLAHIESTARAATPGPWLLQTDSCDCGGDYPCSHGSYPYEILAPARQVEHYPTLQPGVLEAARLANFPEAVDATMADAEHMTTSDPTTVLALTAHIAALESALGRFILAFDVGDVVHATANGRGFAALAEARALLEARDA